MYCLHTGSLLPSTCSCTVFNNQNLNSIKTPHEQEFDKMLPSSILDIIALVYYVPALVLSIIVLIKQGKKGIAGWISLTLICIFRIMGSSAGIAAEYKPTTASIAISLIFANIGTISLIAALMGIIKRAHTSMSSHVIPSRPLVLVSLPITAAAALAIIGGTDLSDSDLSDQQDGRTYVKIAVILLLVVYVAAAGLCAYTSFYKHKVLASERRLLLASTLSLPFVLIRLTLAFCEAFRPNDPNFNSFSATNNAVIIRALMGILMEWIVVAIFLWAGLTVKLGAVRGSRLESKSDIERVGMK